MRPERPGSQCKRKSEFNSNLEKFFRWLIKEGRCDGRTDAGKVSLLPGEAGAVDAHASDLGHVFIGWILRPHVHVKLEKNNGMLRHAFGPLGGG